MGLRRRREVWQLQNQSCQVASVPRVGGWAEAEARLGNFYLDSRSSSWEADSFGGTQGTDFSVQVLEAEDNASKSPMHGKWHLGLGGGI